MDGWMDGRRPVMEDECWLNVMKHWPLLLSHTLTWVGGWMDGWIDKKINGWMMMDG